LKNEDFLSFRLNHFLFKNIRKTNKQTNGQID